MNFTPKIFLKFLKQLKKDLEKLTGANIAISAVVNSQVFFSRLLEKLSFEAIFEEPFSRLTAFKYGLETS